MASKVQVLICTGRFSVHLELQSSICLPDDGGIQHWDFVVIFQFKREFDRRVGVVKVCRETVNDIFFDDGHGVIDIAAPEPRWVQDG